MLVGAHVCVWMVFVCEETGVPGGNSPATIQCIYSNTLTKWKIIRLYGVDKTPSKSKQLSQAAIIVTINSYIRPVAYGYIYPCYNSVLNLVTVLVRDVSVNKCDVITTDNAQ